MNIRNDVIIILLRNLTGILKMKKLISSALLATMLCNVTACGTLLYPERSGQRSGRIDPSIVILDGIGILFFVIPGLIAFAVDFGNGTIYLPGGRSSLDTNDMVALNSGNGKLTQAEVNAIVLEKTGVDIASEHVEIYKVGSNGQKVRVN